jgi:hypothetical protein
MEHKIVAHMKDGRIHKGMTHDFDPERETLHLLPAEGGGVPLRLRLEDMKAVFWVKDYIGNRQFSPRRGFGTAHGDERKAIAVFADGEEIWGTLDDPSEGERGFFLTPADPEDNNVRVYVVRSALKELRAVP